MDPVLANVAALAVVAIYYLWRACERRRVQLLRQRVAFMLWMMADRPDRAAPAN